MQKMSLRPSPRCWSGTSTVMTEWAEAYAVQRPEAEAIRELVLTHLRHGRTYEAIHAARTLLEQQPGRRTHRFLRDALAETAGATSGLKHVKLALLSSFSIEFLHDSLMALGFLGGMRLEIYQAGFGTFRQELLDPASDLYAWSPAAVFLGVEGSEWIPEAFVGYTDAMEQGFDE